MRRWLKFAFPFCAFGLCAAQTQQGPIRTPQLNNNLYVGQPGQTTIQATVAKACLPSSPGAMVVILPGVTTPDNPTGVTGGCTKAHIADERLIPIRYYTWNGTVYILTGGDSASLGSSGVTYLACTSTGCDFKVPVTHNGSTITGGASGVAVEHIFTTSGALVFTHNLNTINPLYSCMSYSGATSFSVRPNNANSVIVTVPAAADIICSFIYAPSAH